MKTPISSPARVWSRSHREPDTFLVLMARVLIVDDSAVARIAATKRLGELGVEATALASSQEAIGVAPAAFSAALLDIDLGDGFGTDVAENLRRGSPELP